MATPIDRAASLTIGAVESVSPDEIHVLLDIEAPQTVALNAGLPTPFPRVNSFVLIPNETGSVVGLIVFLGVEKSPFPRRPGLKDFGLVDLPFPLRKLHVTPVGTLRERRNGSGTYVLERGVSAFPSVGDAVLVPSGEQLRSIIEASGTDQRVHIGNSPVAGGARVFVDPDKLFGRHLAVLGNTGSGKSCSVAGLIRWSLQAARQERIRQDRDPRPAARFIVLDPNGEYLRTFGDIEPPPTIFQVEPTATAQRLRVPAWMWNTHEWTAFAQASPRVQRPLLLEGLRNIRSGASAEVSVPRRVASLFAGYRGYLQSLVRQGPTSYTAFPKNKTALQTLDNIKSEAERYSVRSEQHAANLDAVAAACSAVLGRRRDNRGNVSPVAEQDLEEVVTALDALLAQIDEVVPELKHSEDDPVEFDLDVFPEYLEAIAAREVGGSEQFIATLVWRIRNLLRDSRLQPVVGAEPPVDLSTWLSALVGDRSGDPRIAVVDLSLVPAEIIHTVISVVARLVFEAIQRSRRRDGVELPTVVVLEEAHTFVHRGSRDDDNEVLTPAQMCRMTFEKLAREGRKFGLGLVLASQRPYELSSTVLAQCNTFLLHRLVNDLDQQLVTRLVPDNVRGILRELPSLPAGQAILLGWAAAVPVLVNLHRLPVAHQPHSSDPRFWDAWTGASDRRPDWPAVTAEWLGQDGQSD